MFSCRGAAAAPCPLRGTTGQSSAGDAKTRVSLCSKQVVFPAPGGWRPRRETQAGSSQTCGVGGAVGVGQGLGTQARGGGLTLPGWHWGGAGWACARLQITDQPPFHSPLTTSTEAGWCLPGGR